MRTNYDPSRLSIIWSSKCRNEWVMAKRRVVGVVNVYQVIDRNFRKHNAWTFHVHTPDKRCTDDNIIVRPEAAPTREHLGWIEGKSITFRPTDRPTQFGDVYCKVNIADASGWKTKVGTRRGERDALPRWLGCFRYRMRLKRTVKDTQGTDENSQVILLRRDDHVRMIQVFFVLRVWPQVERFVKR